MTIGLKVATGYYYKYTCESSQVGENGKISGKSPVWG